MARDTGAGRYVVDAVSKALQLLGAFSIQEQQLSLSEFAGRTGLRRVHTQTAGGFGRGP